MTFKFTAIRNLWKRIMSKPQVLQQDVDNKRIELLENISLPQSTMDLEVENKQTVYTSFIEQDLENEMIKQNEQEREFRMMEELERQYLEMKLDNVWIDFSYVVRPKAIVCVAASVRSVQLDDLDDLQQVVDEVFTKYKSEYKSFFVTHDSPLRGQFNETIFRSLCCTFQFGNEKELIESLWDYNDVQKSTQSLTGLSTKRKNKFKKSNFYLFL